ncbi:MAG: hypothetical protein JRN54_10185 [Nitrososphaerota archaeon]|jgi:hypothetical protein|nr:hypothetical protein [Nitrososphaerota archaeon]
MSSGKAEFKRKRKAGLKDLPQPQRRIAEQLVDLAVAAVEAGVTPAVRALVDQDMPTAFAFLGEHLDPTRPTPRVEANAMTAYCFRNGPLEDIHAGVTPLDQRRMKALMIDSSRKADAWLRIRDLALEHAPDAWWAWVNAYNYCYCKRWAVK